MRAGVEAKGFSDSGAREAGRLLLEPSLPVGHDVVHPICASVALPDVAQLRVCFRHSKSGFCIFAVGELEKYRAILALQTPGSRVANFSNLERGSVVRHAHSTAKRGWCLSQQAHGRADTAAQKHECADPSHGSASKLFPAVIPPTGGSVNR